MALVFFGVFNLRCRMGRHRTKLAEPIPRRAGPLYPAGDRRKQTGRGPLR